MNRNRLKTLVALAIAIGISFTAVLYRWYTAPVIPTIDIKEAEKDVEQSKEDMVEVEKKVDDAAQEVKEIRQKKLVARKKNRDSAQNIIDNGMPDDVYPILRDHAWSKLREYDEATARDVGGGGPSPPE
jgi:hypothetical protein